MKRIFSFLVLAVFFSGCDDGDLQEVSFEFNDTSAEACNISGKDENYFIYKTTDQRALLLQLSEKNFSNTITADTLEGQPIDLEIGVRNKLIYRVYSGTLGTSTICSAIPPSSPVVTEERIATGGNILITTTPIKTSIDETTGANKITHYKHTITFSDITFSIGDGSQRNETLPPLIYQRPAPSFAPFDGLAILKNCSNSPKLLFKYNANVSTNAQALLLRLSDAAIAVLFTNETGVIKKQYFGTAENAENSLTHVFFGSTATNPLTDAYFCASVTPAYPTVKDQWKAADGSEEDENGVIEVVTTPTETGFKHTITLRSVKMIKGSQDFFLKREFVFGEFNVTVTP